MKKIITLTTALAVALAVHAATTQVIVSTEPGTRDVGTLRVGKPVHIEAIGCLPAAQTVTVYRVTGSATNQIASAALSSGAANAAVTGTNYVLAGDTLLFGGTYTSGVVRVIFEAD